MDKHTKLRGFWPRGQDVPTSLHKKELISKPQDNLAGTKGDATSKLTTGW